MNLKLIALASAAMIGLTAIAIPDQAEARWRRGGWWIPGAAVGGLALGAAVASRPYYYGGPYYAFDYGPYNSGPYYYGGGYGYGGVPTGTTSNRIRTTSSATEIGHCTEVEK
jgi:hypothetical protein